MSFFNECSYILRKSNKDMIFIDINSKLMCSCFKNSETPIHYSTITSSDIDFTNCYFDIDKNDNIYGIVNDRKINIVQFDCLHNKFNYIYTIEYDFKNFSLDFPYIYMIDNDIHIIYYLTSQASPTTILFHHYRHNNKWIENKIDFINTPVLDNFTVFFNNNSPIIFYLRDIDGIPQVLTSTFNLSTCIWSTPLQITNSIGNKFYLSIIKDYLNFYHIVFAESSENAYCLRYINGYLSNDSFNIELDKLVTPPGEYSFPTLIKHKEKIYLMWVSNKILYTSVSKDLGVSWSNFLEDEFSMTNKFIRGYIKSNYSIDLDYICSSLFISRNEISILGFDTK